MHTSGRAVRATIFGPSVSRPDRPVGRPLSGTSPRVEVKLNSGSPVTIRSERAHSTGAAATRTAQRIASPRSAGRA
jgi:hypothetical protein